MRNKIGRLCIFVGMCMLCCSLALYIHNDRQAAAADLSASEIMAEIHRVMPRQPQTSRQDHLVIPQQFITREHRAMTEVEINGFSYIGYLAIPKLEVELPVMSQWDDYRLKLSPCRYTGTVRENNMVVMAHNYRRHFGSLSTLAVGDSVIFTDMDGVIWCYEVTARDLLPPTAVEEVTSGISDLTLFTCTYDGNSRVVVYCDAV